MAVQGPRNKEVVMASQEREVMHLTGLGDDENDEEAHHSHDESPFASVATRRDPRAVLNVDLSAVVLVFIINFLDSLGGSISTPILPFYAKEFHASYAEVGQLFSVFAFAQMASMPFLSYASDRYGRRAVLLVATLGTAMGAIWQGTATSYTSLLVSRVFSGLWSGVASVCQVYIVDVVPQDCRAEYMSYLNSSTQASVLFGPSIGAGLSALGLNAPLLVQGLVSLLLTAVVWAHLPESPEWCRVHCMALPSPGRLSMTAAPANTARKPGMGRRTTFTIIAGFGTLQFYAMVAQMGIMSMFAVFAETVYQLDSVQVGFTMTLGAISSVGTNIWISPYVLKTIGELHASLLGFALILAGSLVMAMQPFALSVLGFMVAYQGLAINSSAVATAAANLTDSTSRATIMTGVRMMKSLGAVVGPIFSGHLALLDVRLPFIGAAGFGLVGLVTQVALQPVIKRARELIRRRRVVGQETGLLDGQWIDEHGTPEEIEDLGKYVASLLTARHYRWVTYNEELKGFLSDCFPPVATESEEAHKSEYRRRRQLVREKQDYTYEELLERHKRLCDENAELRKELRGSRRDPSLERRRRSRAPSNGGWDVEDDDRHHQHLGYHQIIPPVSGFGAG